MPSDHEWLVYERWAEEKGSDLIHFDVLGTDIVVLRSLKAASELLDKRSSIYSDRPFTPALSVLLGFDWVLASFPYGEKFRAMRKAFHTSFQPSVVKDYYPLHRRAAHQLLKNILSAPDETPQHLRYMAGGVILDIAYGIKTKPRDDPYVEAAERALSAVTTVVSPSARLFDMFPMLLYMPSWVPGAGYKKTAKFLQNYSRDILENPFQFTKEALANGTASPSIATTMLSQLGKNSSQEDELLAKQLTANVYIAGADTTVCAIQNFLLAMMLYPDTQRRAQTELDSVIGCDRLPDLSNIDALPYVNALVLEVLRRVAFRVAWGVVAPLGFPHRLMVNDSYEGYFLPRGSLFIGNIWAMLHDKSVYGVDAQDFNPQRFLDHDLPEPDVVWGFGRRVCPGRHMARDSVWLAIASILATFNINKALDEKGEEIEVVDDHISGIVAYPVPFKSEITPRSADSVMLIQSTEIYD
ncbi:cytochrome P450 [Stereum hirsutum FP-91666 SS1]|uniref:cytochrome P450 n=1 Tax=Stereum hirsutum (strain FP-91666) TaxID=721885 RepID=UPI000444A676|nr:cytochrome P450 [Stereum hirsutum FP-91666 SS1]EIM84309.1 cytochrome P450 [Stereum hirsutum FP-91666 SS1]